MPSKNRETLLKIGVGVVVGLFVLDRMVLGPAIEAWKTQGERLAEVRQKVERGRGLLEREKSIRARWNDMQRGDLAEDHSEAENEVFKGIARWASASRVSFTNLTPQWRSHEEGYDAFECRATATGSQDALGRLLYEIESDALPMRIEECEVSTRDNKGQQLALSVRFSAVRIHDERSAR
jgi:Type II secretion system (T2SS), protein M subtype b